MRFIFVVWIFSLGLALSNLHTITAELATILQKKCEGLLYDNSHSDLQSALVCGSNLTQSSKWKAPLQQLGLIHMAVVSGAHFISLALLCEFLFQFIKAPHLLGKTLILIILILYALVTGLQPPAVRSLLTLILSSGFYLLRIPATALQQLLLSVLICWGIHAPWLHSLSLLLSAFAGLVLCWPLNEPRPLQNMIIKQCLFFIILMPALASFQPISWIHFFTNILLGPALSLLLFPLAGLGLAHPWLTQVFNWFAEGFWQLIQPLLSLTPTLKGPALTLTEIQLWLIWITLWLALDFYERRRRRAHWHY